MSSAQTPGEREILEQLPGELRRGSLGLHRFVFALLARAVLVSVLLVASLGAWPVYGLSVLIWGRAPNVPRQAQIWRYLGYAWTVREPGVRLPLHHRLWLSLSVLLKLATKPMLGLAWQLDELLYGGRLEAAAVVEPLFVISAARSGSTQISRYLEEDPMLVSPMILQLFFPYLWLWRLVAATLGRVVSKDAVRAKFERSLRPEFLERHEADPFRTDTFEGALFLGHLNGLSLFLGPTLLAQEFALGEAAAHNHALWHEDFVNLLDRIARKTLVWTGADVDGSGRRVFAKGHFLAAADAVEQRFPDARFLTVIRHPSKRLRSAANFLRVNPVDLTLGEPPWAALGPGVAESEARYCEVEQAWFTRKVGARRCVIRFSDYVADLGGTMREVYSACLGQDEPPVHVPRVHTPRRRSEYAIDRTLAQMGIDQQALETRLADYIEWCTSERR